MGDIVKFVIKLLVMIVLMPIYWLASLLIMVVGVVNSVIIGIGSIAGGIIILVTLIEIVTKGNLKSNWMLLVLGALCIVVPCVIQGLLEGTIEVLGGILERVAEI